jgi:hypothetical protein
VPGSFLDYAYWSFDILFGVAVAWMGYALWRQRGVPVEQTSSESQELARTASSSLSNLVWWGGLAAVLGAALFILGNIVEVSAIGPGAQIGETGTMSAYTFAAALGLLGSLLMLLGLVGLYARQSEAIGAFGLVGFLGAFIGTGMFAGGSWTDTFVTPFPELLDNEPLAIATALGVMLWLVFFVLGWLLFGAAILWAGILPRLAVGLLLISLITIVVLSIAVPEPDGGLFYYVQKTIDILFNLAMAWLGFAVLKGRSLPAEQPSGVSEVPEGKLSPS